MCWTTCRSMMVRVIAVRDPNFVYSHHECVMTTQFPSSPTVLHGPAPVPVWGRRRGHTQSHINQLAGYVGLYDGPRDLGLDQHHDDMWRNTGGVTQNMVPYGVLRSDFTGVANRPEYFGQYEEESEVSDADNDEDSYQST